MSISACVFLCHVLSDSSALSFYICLSLCNSFFFSSCFSPCLSLYFSLVNLLVCLIVSLPCFSNISLANYLCMTVHWLSHYLFPSLTPCLSGFLSESLSVSCIVSFSVGLALALCMASFPSLSLAPSLLLSLYILSLSVFLSPIYSCFSLQLPLPIFLCLRLSCFMSVTLFFCQFHSLFA